MTPSGTIFLGHIRSKIRVQPVKTSVKRSQMSQLINELIADEEWLEKYPEKKQLYDEHLKELQGRLDGTEELSTW